MLTLSFHHTRGYDTFLPDKIDGRLSQQRILQFSELLPGRAHDPAFAIGDGVQPMRYLEEHG
ncbi:hypothetical protein ABTD33_19680, partial [Acinetobacter baumannii]